MKVAIKVISGSNAGKEFTMPGEKFMIGRAPECQLRPGSSDISGKHCVLIAKEEKLVIEDLNSTNGTFVNEEKIESETQLSTGDKFRVGPLEFEVTVSHELAGKKRSKVTSIREAAARTASATKEEKKEDLDIDDLLGLDEEPVPDRVFNLDDIKEVKSQEQLDEIAKKEAAAEKKAKKGKGKPKKKYGKLPTNDDDAADPSDTREAAQDMLKKLFKD